MKITHSISLDFQRFKTPSQIDVVQNDTYSRYVKVTLYDNMSEWAVPDGVTVAVRFKKPDRTQGVYDTLPDGTVAYSVESNIVTVGVAPQMLTVKGKVTASVVMFLGNTQLATFPFILNVVENPAAGQSVSNDYYYLQTWDDVNAAIGSLDDLKTADKSSLVAAINEVARKGGTGTGGEVFVPKAQVTQTANGARIIITDQHGTSEATVNHGKDGEPGVYILAEGETIADAPADADVVIDPAGTPDVDLSDYAKTEDIPTDAHINNLINTALGVIENGSY